MLKVLYLPIGKQHGTEDAFRELGCDLTVLEINTKNKPEFSRQFLNLIKTTRPHLCHMQLQMTNALDANTIVEARKLSPNTIFSNWTGDIRIQPSAYFISISNVVHFALLSNIGQIELYKKHGGNNIYYWQTGYDHKCYKPLNKTSFKYDVTFAGSAYGTLFPDAPLRKNIVERLKEQYKDKFGLFGDGHPKNYKAQSVDIRNINEVYNDSKVVLSVSNFNDEYHYFSDRLPICLASGRPCIAYRFPGAESYLKHMQDALMANSIDDIIKYVDFCLANPDIADEIGKTGALIAESEHTFRSRVSELLEMTGVSHLL